MCYYGSSWSLNGAFMPEWITDPRTIIAVLAAIGGVGYWVGQVNSGRNSFKKFIAEVRDDIKTILMRLPPAYVGSGSPISLTDVGESAAEILNAHEWANKQAGGLVAECEELKEYEIYDLCQEYVMTDRSRWPDNMSECAYEFGTPVEPLTNVLMVVLRDELLKRLEEAGSKVSQDR